MAKSLYYRIGQACKQVDVQPYVLRYWETEFAVLAPDKSKSGQRVYSEEDLQVIRRIKELLYDEGFTIAGAKKRLEAELNSGGPKTKPVSESAAEEDGDEPADGPEEAPVAEPEEKTAEPAEPPLDTAASQRIETLAQGVEEALDQARDLLTMLDKPPAKKRRSKKRSSKK